MFHTGFHSLRVLLLFALCTLVNSAFIADRNVKLPTMFIGRPPGGFKQSAYSQYIVNPADPSTFPVALTMSQILNHKDPLSTTFYQRYWYNPQYAYDSGIGPVAFLVLGGEAPENGGCITDMNWHHVQLAQMFGAHLFCLEHRFFGESIPNTFGDKFNMSMLSLLTTEQAVQDVIGFKLKVEDKFKLKAPKWVLFGETYSGVLAAKIRARYPLVTVAALASSAAILERPDNPGYSNKLESNLGSIYPNDKQCNAMAASLFKTLNDMLATAEGRNQLNQYLHLDPPLNGRPDNLSTSYFFSNIHGMFAAMQQYWMLASFKEDQKLNPILLCNTLFLSGDPVRNLWTLYQKYMTFFSSKVPDKWKNAHSYSDFVQELKSQYDGTEIKTDTRSNGNWLWLSCNELGRMPTTASSSMFGEIIPLSFYSSLCKDVFNLDYPATLANMPSLNNYTDVSFAYGKQDPWTELGDFNVSDPRNLHPIIISNAGQLADFVSTVEAETISIVTAREEKAKFLENALKMTRGSTARPPVYTTRPLPVQTTTHKIVTVAPTHAAPQVSSTKVTTTKNPVQPQTTSKGNTQKPVNQPTTNKGPPVVPTKVTYWPPQLITTPPRTPVETTTKSSRLQMSVFSVALLFIVLSS